MQNFWHLHFITDVYWVQNFDFHFTDWCLCLSVFIFTTSLTTVSTMSDSQSYGEEGMPEDEELGLNEEMQDDGSDWEDASSDEDDDEPPARRAR